MFNLRLRLICMVAGASRSVHGGLTLVQLLEIVVLVVIIIVIIVIIIVLLQRWGAGNFGMLIWAETETVSQALKLISRICCVPIIVLENVHDFVEQ